MTLPGNQCCCSDSHCNRYKSQTHSNHNDTDTSESEDESDLNNFGNKWSPSNSVDKWSPSNSIDKWSPSNSIDMETEETDTQTDEDDSFFTPSYNHMCSKFKDRLGHSFMKSENEPPKVTARSRSFRIFRLRNNAENDPHVAMDSDDSSDSLPDLPDITEILKAEKRKKCSILKFAKNRKREIDKFLSEYQLETQRRPCVRSLGQMYQFEQKHPEIFARMKARLEIPDGDLYALNNYLCEVYCDELRGDGPAFLMMQKLEDIVDFIVKLYIEQ